MREFLRGYLAAILEDASNADRAAALGRELEVFAAALLEHENLRGVLTDPGVDALQRRKVIDDLLAGRAIEETASLVAFVVRAERPSDLPLVIAQLAEATRRAAQGEDRDGGELAPGGGHARELLRGYCERVFQDQDDASAIDELEDELFRFARILDDNHELARALSDSAVALERRVHLLDELLAGKTSAAMLRLARAALRAGRVRDLVGTFDLLVELAAKERGRRVAEVRSAVELDEDERARLADALGRLVERTVEVRVIIDPSVVGGMLVTVGDLVIDGTIRLRLERLREALAGSS